MTNTKTNLFCSGHTFLPDGRLLVTGGRRSRELWRPGSQHLRLSIEPRAPGRPSRGLPASYARWYASAVGLGDGDVLLLAGNINGGSDPNHLPQVWQRRRWQLS